MAAINRASCGLSDFTFQYVLQTRWKDMDAFSHVNNAVFLSYIEDARITFFKRWDLCDKKRSIIMASVRLDYFQQINHPSDLIVGQKISRVGRKSFDIESAVFIQDVADPVASSMVTCVCFDYEKNESVSVYPQIIEDYKKS